MEEIFVHLIILYMPSYVYINQYLFLFTWYVNIQWYSVSNILEQGARNSVNVTNFDIYVHLSLNFNLSLTQGIFFLLALQSPSGVVFCSPLAGFSLLAYEVSWSHTTTCQSVGLRTNDQSVAETSTWQHTTLTTDKHPSPGWDSNPRSQQASGRRPTP